MHVGSLRFLQRKNNSRFIASQDFPYTVPIILLTARICYPLPLERFNIIIVDSMIQRSIFLSS